MQNAAQIASSKMSQLPISGREVGFQDFIPQSPGKNRIADRFCTIKPTDHNRAASAGKLPVCRRPLETVDTQPYIWFNEIGIIARVLESAIAVGPEP